MLFGTKGTCTRAATAGSARRSGLWGYPGNAVVTARDDDGAAAVPSPGLTDEGGYPPLYRVVVLADARWGAFTFVLLAASQNGFRDFPPEAAGSTPGRNDNLVYSFR